MVISDLNYLEVVTETSSVIGGSKWKPSKPKNKKSPVVVFPLNIDITKQSNVTVINQTATSTATAISFGGDAKATSTATNKAEVTNVNAAG
jgi:hypothetical protein